MDDILDHILGEEEPADGDVTKHIVSTGPTKKTTLGSAIEKAKSNASATTPVAESKPLDPKYGMAPQRENTTFRPVTMPEMMAVIAGGQQIAERRSAAAVDDDQLEKDIEQKRTEIKILTQRRDALYHNASPEAVAQRDVVESTLGKAQNELAELLRQQEEAQKAQSYYRYADMPNNADYAEKSQFVQQPVDPYDALSNRASLYDFVNDKNGARQKIASEYGRGPSYLYGDWTPYAHLSEDEKGVFNYIYATEGEGAAKEYLDYLTESLTARQGADIAERMKNAGGVSQALYGVTSGVNQFGSGIQRTIQRTFAENPQMDTTAVEYATSNILNDLSEEGKKGAEFAFKVAQMAGQMAPSLLLSGAVGSILKAAGLGAKALNIARNAIFSGSISLSSSGNAYKTGIEQYGMNHEQAQMYANLVGASEGGLTYLLGGIGQGGALVNKLLGGNGAAKFAAKVANIDNAIARFVLQFGGQLLPRMGGEALEENLQLVLEPAFRTILTGEDYDAPEINEIIETTLLSAVTSGLMSAPSAVGTAMQGGRPTPTPTQPTVPELRAEDLLLGVNPAVSENAQSAVETPAIPEAETVAENIEAPQNETSEVKLSPVEQTVRQDEVQRQEAPQYAPEEQSVGAAPAGFEGDTIRSFSKNIATDMNREEALREESREAPERYFRLSHAETEAKARAIFDKGLSEARSVLESALTRAKEGWKLSPEMVPLTKLVADELTRQGDLYTANRFVAEMAAELTAAGELTNAAVILREASPSTVRTAIQKGFDKINKAVGINATAQEQEAFVRAINESREEAFQRLKSMEAEYAPILSQSKESPANSPKKNAEEKSWVQMLGEALAKNVSNRYTTGSAKPQLLSRTMVSDLVKFAENYALPKRPQRAKRTAADRVADFFNNREEYSNAWNIARKQVQEKYADDPAALEAFEEWLNGTISYNASGSDAVMLQAIADTALAEDIKGKKLTIRSKTDADALVEQLYNSLNKSVQAEGSNAVELHNAVERFVNERALELSDKKLASQLETDIRKALKDIGSKMGEIIESSPGSKQAVAESIAKMIVNDYGISSAEAENVADMVVEQFNEMVADATAKRLDNMFRERTPVQKKSAREKFAKLAHLGAFSNAQYSEQAMQQVFGIKSEKWQAKFTEDEIKEIQNTDWSQDGAFEAFYDKVAARLGREMPSSLWEKLVEIRRVAMLLNPKTQIKNFVANAPLMVMRKGSEALSGAVQGALVKMGVMDAADRTRTAFYSKQSKDIARQLYEQNKEDLKNRSNRWDMNSLLRDHRKYFGDSMIGRAADAARAFTYELLERGDSPYMRSAFIDNAARYIEAQGYTSLDAVPQEVIDFAGQQALEATFKDASQLSDFINKIKRQGGAAGAALDILFPFTTTPINITKRMYEYSPAALAKFLNREFRQQDLATKIDAVSKSTIGSFVVALGFFMAKLGWITGGADDDRDKAAWDKATGKSPYSFGGKASYDWAQPAGSLLAIGAELANAAKGDQSVLDAILNSVYVGGDAFLELSFFQNVLDLMKGYGSSTEQIATEIAESGVSQMAPTFMGAIARTVDDTARTTYGADITGNETVDRTLAGFMSKTPGLSKLLPESVNIKGETAKRADTWWERALYEGVVPANVNVAGKTAVDQLIDDLFEATGNKNVYPNQAPKTVQGETEELTMTGEERAQYQRTMGQTYMDLMGALLGDDGPESLTPEQQAKATEYIKEYSNAVAKEEFLESRGENFESTTEKQAALDDLADFFGVKAAYALADKAKDFDAIEALLGDYNALSDEAKELMDNSHSRLDDIAAANDAGISVADWDKAYTAWKGIKDAEGMTASAKATEFAAWVDTNGFTRSQGNVLKELLSYSSGFTVGADKYEDLTGNGLSAKDAQTIVEEISALTPLPGAKDVSNAQKYSEILSTFRTQNQQMAALESYMPESTYAKLETAVDGGFSAKEFVDFYSKFSTTDAKENGKTVSGLKKQRVKEWALEYGFTNAEFDTLWKMFN